MHIPRLRHLPWIQRIALIGTIEALTFGVMILLFRGITAETVGAALLVSGAIGLVNSLVRPILVRLGIVPSLLIFSILAFASNVLMVWLAIVYAPGFAIGQIWLIALVSAILAAINVSFSDLFAIDDDDSYYQHLLSHIIDLSPQEEVGRDPGIVFLEIDGLSKRILKRAIREGFMPTLARWEREGRYRITGWECNVPCQTSASQAGILLGSNFDVPAFRWYEKDRQKTMVSNRPADAAELERRLSKGVGLLARGGASRANLLSGDAPIAMFTFSTLSDSGRHSTQDFYPLFMGPYNVLRIALLFIWDLLAEIRAARYQRRQDERPRIHRGGVYPLLRAATTVLMRELSAYVVIGDMYSGVPSVYATFFGYDEVAHHSGIEREDALAVLRDLDTLFNRLDRASRRTPRPYQFVILSDHGQSQGATFKQRYDMTLEQLVGTLITDGQTVESEDTEDAAWGNLRVVLTDVLHDLIPDDDHLASRLLRRAVKNRIYVEDGGATSAPQSDSSSPAKPDFLVPYIEKFSQERAKLDQALDPYRAGLEKQQRYLEQVIVGPLRKDIDRAREAADEKPAEVVVMASGNLGLIYFTQWNDRMSYELINETFPDLLKGLANHEGIGFLLVRSEEHGPLALGPEGVYYLKDRRVEGEDPLINFGRNAAEHMRRLDSFPHVADIMVNSLYDPETGEVAAFEELVGSHGGLGGDQMAPFVMFPAEWELENEQILGASELHAQLIKWLEPQSEE
ncbi:MAG: phage holin family protein [Anaerolineales bacterium]